MVRKAIIPAAGLGTRFLPATKAVPKELLPIVDQPSLQYVIDECVSAGIQEIALVISAGKQAIERHFESYPPLEDALKRSGKIEELSAVRAIGSGAAITYVMQPEPKGLGHAVGCAREFAGDEPFVVALPDELCDPGSRSLEKLIGLYEERGGSAIAVQEVPAEEIHLYGAIEPEALGDGVFRVLSVVEKPDTHLAPSNLAVTGRYVFGPDIFEVLDRTIRGRGGEIQLADALDSMARSGKTYAVKNSGRRWDVGMKLGYLKACVEFASQRQDLGPDFMSFLADFVRSRAK